MSGRRAASNDRATPTPAAQASHTLVKGLRILSAFRPGEPYLGNKEIALRTELTRSAVSRLAGTLVQLGYLRYSHTLGKYTLGTSVLALAYPMLAGLSIRQIARPFMKSLADAVGGQVSMGMASGCAMVFIESSRSEKHRHTLPEAGATIPMLASAMGRAYLVALSPTARDKLLGKLRASAPDEWGRYEAKVAQALRDYVHLGFTQSLGDVRPEMHACAVPLRTKVDDELIVMNCSVPAYKLKRGALEREIGHQLVATARQIDAAMGNFSTQRPGAATGDPALGLRASPVDEPGVGARRSS